MVRYLSYEEYLARGGTLGEGDFEACAARADGRIDALTCCRVRNMSEVPEAVKEAMMTAIRAASDAGTERVASSSALEGFSTDGYSERYRSAGEQWEAVERAANREIRTLLVGVCDDAGTPLTYAGGLE